MKALSGRLCLVQAASSQCVVASVAWFDARANMAFKHINLTAWHNASSSDQTTAGQHLKIILGNVYSADYLSQFPSPLFKQSADLAGKKGTFENLTQNTVLEVLMKCCLTVLPVTSGASRESPLLL